LGAHVVHSAETIGVMYIELRPNPTPQLPFRLRTGNGMIACETAEPYLRKCTDGALKKAGVELKDISFIVTATPNMWYSKFVTSALNFDPTKTINMHPAYANIGPVLMPANLFHAALEGKITKGDLVLLYSVGSLSSVGAAVVRWGDVKLGPPPEPGVAEE
jgi:3-oxoacyl-[acyl-carrier-protein] synthase III